MRKMMKIEMNNKNTAPATTTTTGVKQCRHPPESNADEEKKNIF